MEGNRLLAHAISEKRRDQMKRFSNSSRSCCGVMECFFRRSSRRMARCFIAESLLNGRGVLEKNGLFSLLELLLLLLLLNTKALLGVYA